MILLRKGWMMVIYTPYGAFVTFQTTKQIFYTAHVRNPPHDMEWTLLSHGPPLKLVPPFLLMILMGLLRGFSVSSIEVKKNRRLKLRELSPALIPAFQTWWFFILSAVHFPGGVCVYEMTRPPQKKQPWTSCLNSDGSKYPSPFRSNSFTSASFRSNFAHP